MLVKYCKILFIFHLMSSISEQSSTATSYIDQSEFWRNFRSQPSKPSKYYYYFAPRSYKNDLSPLASDRGDYEQYSGYQAHWPTHTPQPQPIYIHAAAPYHKEEKHQYSYLLPLLLLALLPLLFGALLLLPLLFIFFTNVLQLLALLQQNLQNATTAATNVGRRRREIDGVNPLLTTTVLSLVENLSIALDKYCEDI